MGTNRSFTVSQISHRLARKIRSTFKISHRYNYKSQKVTLIDRNPDYQLHLTWPIQAMWMVPVAAPGYTRRGGVPTPNYFLAKKIPVFNLNVGNVRLQRVDFRECNCSLQAETSVISYKYSLKKLISNKLSKSQSSLYSLWDSLLAFEWFVFLFIRPSSQLEVLRVSSLWLCP